MKRSLLATILLALLVACGGAEPAEKHRSIGSALSAPTLTPLPMMFDPADPSRRISAWKGSPVELLYADALASCSYEQASSDAFVSDSYYAHIFGLMGMVQCPIHPDPNHPGQTLDYSGSPVEVRWRLQRADPYCNIDPSTEAQAFIRLGASLPTIDATNLPVEPPFGGPAVNETAFRARQALHVPVTNLCIAQQLRSRSPGVSSGEALLLSAADQREVLALTKERAQMAMLQFALLGQVFATPPAANPGAISNAPGGNPSAFIPMLQHWAQEATTARPNLRNLVTELGEDLASAVQLHVVASSRARAITQSKCGGAIAARCDLERSEVVRGGHTVEGGRNVGARGMARARPRVSVWRRPIGRRREQQHSMAALFA